VDLGHVLELHQAVGAERLVAWGLAEPLVAALLGLVAGEQLVAAVEDAAGALDELGVGGVVGAEVAEDHDVGVVVRRGLLEAAARLLDHALEPLGHGGDRRRVEGDGGAHAAGERAGEIDAVASGAVERAGVRDQEREAERHDAHRLLDLVLQAAGVERDADLGLAVGLLDGDRVEEGLLLAGGEGHRARDGGSAS
jgi:hypothetical protein